LIDPIRRKTMPQFSSQAVAVIKAALDGAMKRVPSRYATVTMKVYLAECILKAAAQGETSYGGLVTIATNQIQDAITLLFP
jgi:hypothetical protein